MNIINHTNISEKDFYTHSEKLGETEPLLLAARNGNVDLVKKLINQGIDVNYQGTKFGSTALMYASQNKQANCVKELLLLGADVNIRNKSQTTALQFAIENKHFDCVKELIIFGADFKNLTMTTEMKNFIEQCTLPITKSARRY